MNANIFWLDRIDFDHEELHRSWFGFSKNMKSWKETLFNFALSTQSFRHFAEIYMSRCPKSCPGEQIIQAWAVVGGVDATGIAF